MIYRVVRRGGRYQPQYRVCFFWWVDSWHPAEERMADAVSWAESVDQRFRPRQRVVWPIPGAH